MIAGTPMLFPEIQPDPPPVVPDTLYEVVNGERVELPPMGAFENWVASVLARFMGNHASSHRLGRVVVEMLFLVDRATGLQRRPDLAFVSYDRWPRNRRVARTPAWDVVPDLAVEVVSPTNTAKEILDKILDYFRTGVRLVWVVYPIPEFIHVYESPTTVRVLQRGDTIDGGAVVPGFQLALATWFDEGVEPEPEPNP
jgi:Uma2 family endonuclease